MPISYRQQLDKTYRQMLCKTGQDKLKLRKIAVKSCKALNWNDKFILSSALVKYAA